MNFTQGIQSSSPIDSFVRVLPAPMPGYPFDEVMASGSFTQGSTIELSADAPVKEPYTLYMQGGLSIEYGKLSILLALTQMKNKKKEDSIVDSTVESFLHTPYLSAINSNNRIIYKISFITNQKLH